MATARHFTREELVGWKIDECMHDYPDDYPDGAIVTQFTHHHGEECSVTFRAPDDGKLYCIATEINGNAGYNGIRDASKGRRFRGYVVKEEPELVAIPADGVIDRIFFFGNWPKSHDYELVIHVIPYADRRAAVVVRVPAGAHKSIVTDTATPHVLVTRAWAESQPDDVACAWCRPEEIRRDEG